MCVVVSLVMGTMDQTSRFTQSPQPGQPSQHSKTESSEDQTLESNDADTATPQPSSLVKRLAQVREDDLARTKSSNGYNLLHHLGWGFIVSCTTQPTY